MAWSDGVGFGLNEAEECIRDAGLRGEVVHLIVQQEAGGARDVRSRNCR